MKDETKSTLSVLPDPVPADLADALQDLAGVIEEAREEGCPEPSQLAIDNADRLLREMYRYFQTRYEVYPMLKSDVAIQVADRNKYSVIVLCGSDGDVMCLADMKSGRRRGVYDTADKLPDDFLYGVLDEIKENSE